jgi:tetratricopeptide (TPR) repeat protein
MAQESTPDSTASPTLQATQVYAMAGICLAAGLAIGYVFRGAQPPDSKAQPAAIAVPASAPLSQVGSQPMSGINEMKQMPGNQMQSAVNAAPLPAPAKTIGAKSMPTLADMKQMADKQAAPLLVKLQSDPKNTAMLVQVGAIYHGTHCFKEASVYYGKAVQIDPRNVAFRNKLASSLFRSGDIDGAIAQLNKALAVDPSDANSLFNLGTIKLQGKNDNKGALAAWQHLLKSNPQLSSDRRAMVDGMIANVMTSLDDRHRIEGAKKP